MLTAIRLSPRYATAHHVYAMASLLPLGRFDEAHDEISMAAQIQPHSSFILTCAGILCYFEHRYSQAVKHFDDALELEPQLSVAHWHRGWALQARGDIELAIESLERAVKLSPQPRPQILSALANAYVAGKRRSKAEKLMEQLQALRSSRYVSPFEFAVVYAGFNKKEETLKMLEAAIKDRTPAVTRLKFHPIFEHLTSESGFKRLLAQLGLNPSPQTEA